MQGLQQQVEEALPQLALANLDTTDDAFLLAPAQKAAAALEGLVAALQLQVRRDLCICFAVLQCKTMVACGLAGMPVPSIWRVI